MAYPMDDCHVLSAEVVRKVNELIATGQYGRLFAVVHFASHQWKVTSEDLILIENELDIKCGERIRLEKVGCRWFCGLRDLGTKCASLRGFFQLGVPATVNRE